MGAHLIGGKFQSDKYPTTPLGKVPLSTKDPTAQLLLWAYAQVRRAVDGEFADDLEIALLLDGYVPPPETIAGWLLGDVSAMVDGAIAWLAVWRASKRLEGSAVAA
jgi:hypothetical protein